MALQQDGRIFRAVAWRAAERHDYLTEHRAALDVAFSLEQNQYNGETYRRADARRHQELRVRMQTCSADLQISRSVDLRSWQSAI